MACASPLMLRSVAERRWRFCCSWNPRRQQVLDHGRDAQMFWGVWNHQKPAARCLRQAWGLEQAGTSF
ncbi:mCG1039846, isoform CRA_a [Mus musculus]|nr:mCG1039846, isoform CRA_a [Mus musculus]EDL27743.1 mCG1039846, isoform CRA_a [Mus musculus]